MLVDSSYNTSPTLNGTGYFSLVMSNLHKINCAVVSYDGSTNIVGDMSGAMDMSYAFNTGQGNAVDNSVNIYVFVTVNGARRIATTADLVGHKFCCIATGN